ncbi:hypothetical protein LCGC14_3082900, partial [marine sediment metagenome]
MKLRVQPGSAAGTDVPVCVKVTLPDGLANVPAGEIRVTVHPDGEPGPAVPGQIVRNGDANELWWVLPSVESG